MRLLTNLTRLLVHILGFPYHRHTEDGCLRLSASALSLLGFLAIVLVGFPSAEVHLIQLHFAIKGDRVILCEEGTHLVEYEPRCLLTSIQVTG